VVLNTCAIFRGLFIVTVRNWRKTNQMSLLNVRIINPSGCFWNLENQRNIKVLIIVYSFNLNP